MLYRLLSALMSYWNGCLDYWPILLIPCAVGLARNWRSTTLGHELGKLVFAFWCGWLLRMTVSLESILGDLLTGRLHMQGPVCLVPGRDIVPILMYGDSWTVLVNFGGNIGFFVPFGLIAAMLWPRMRNGWRALLAGAGFSCLIEILQLFTYRVTSVDDVMLNALGALTGCGIYHILHRLAKENV